MNPRDGVLILIALLSFSLPASAFTCSELARKMATSHIPDVAIAAVIHERVSTYFCSTNATAPKPESIFEAASLSKPVFAAAVLSLVHDGKLDLDRPLAEYLPGPYLHRQNAFRKDSPTDQVLDPKFQRITARMVLSHTGGLPNWARNRPLTLQSDPGTSWSYSGEGYVYLQTVVEEITGEPMQEFVQKTVFTPLHMDHSSFVWKTEFETNEMRPRSRTGDAGESSRYRLAVASSTLYTTLADYTKFLQALLSPASASAFALEETQQVEVNPRLALAWGLGVAIQTSPQRAYFHWGANPGFQSFFMVEPGSGRGLLFLTDSDNGLDLLDPLVKRFIPGRHPVLRFPMLHPKD